MSPCVHSRLLVTMFPRRDLPWRDDWKPESLILSLSPSVAPWSSTLMYPALGSPSLGLWAYMCGKK